MSSKEQYFFNNIVLLGFTTTEHAGYGFRTEEDPKVYESCIQGRMFEDHAKIPTRT